MGKYTKNKCILCEKNPPIRESHVIPKFIFNKLKECNPLGVLIDAKHEHLMQDGWKGAYLCRECEEQFSRYEKWFCERIFNPFWNNNLSNVNYKEELKLFHCCPVKLG